MVEIGRISSCKIVKIVDFGVYLDGEGFGEILMPKRYVPSNCKVNDEVEAFIYFDSEDRLIATTEKPLVQVGEFAYLNVVATTKVGAFLDWGLPKDLFVPFREQKQKMDEGKSYMIYVYYDYDSDRIAASAKIDKYLDNLPPEYKEGELVNLKIAQKTDLGYKAIINDLHWGMIYNNEIFTDIKLGMAVTGYIKKIREDEKIDLSLQRAGHEKIYDLSDIILMKLRDNKGVLNISDKSPAEEIYTEFGVSKKNFKKAVGNLYKKRLIKISDNRIEYIG